MSDFPGMTFPYSPLFPGLLFSFRTKMKLKAIPTGIDSLVWWALAYDNYDI